MKDRIPKYPGRVRLTPVQGQTDTFDLVRADEPLEPGTPLNKANLLTDATATALEITSVEPTVDEALYGLLQKSRLGVRYFPALPAAAYSALCVPMSGPSDYTVWDPLPSMPAFSGDTAINTFGAMHGENFYLLRAYSGSSSNYANQFLRYNDETKTYTELNTFSNDIISYGVTGSSFPYTGVAGLVTIGDDIYCVTKSGYIAVYHVLTNIWETKSLWTAMSYGSYVKIVNACELNGEIYAVGSGYFQKYSPTTDTWTSLANLPITNHRSLVVFNNVIYAVGYSNYTSSQSMSTRQTSRYNSETNTWTSIVDPIPMTELGSLNRDDFATLVLSNGIMLTGGRQYHYNTYDSKWWWYIRNTINLFNPETNTLTTNPSPNWLGAYAGFAIFLKNGNVYRFGGGVLGVYNFESISYEAQKWGAIAYGVPVTHIAKGQFYYHSAQVYLDDGKGSPFLSSVVSGWRQAEKNYRVFTHTNAALTIITSESI